MIDKSIVKDLVEQWLEGKDYFLVDIEINSDDKIVVEIDHADGVTVSKKTMNWRWALPDWDSLSRWSSNTRTSWVRKWKCSTPTARNTKAC